MAVAPFIKTKIRKSSGRFLAYGVWWEPHVDPASMQLDCIRAGGRWLNKSTGEMAGEGNYYHYRKFQEIVWPERIWEKGPFKNYWAEKILEGWLEYKYFGLMGCAASGKSDSLGAICLTDWYPFSDCTTTIVSSTELAMLQRRIWGFIEKYHRLAKKRCEWLPGHLVQSKLSILQNSKDEDDDYEGRSHINAIFGVPCKRGNTYTGLGSFVGLHNKRVRLVADECFPEGTLVDTPSGRVPIESISPGDIVISAIGSSRVVATSIRQSRKLITVFAGGKKIRCTPNHPFLTQFGWKKACELNQGCFILSAYEAMQILRSSYSGDRQSQVVQGVLSAKENLPCLRKGISSQEKAPTAYAEKLQLVLQHEIDASRSKNSRLSEQKAFHSASEIFEKESRIFGDDRKDGHWPKTFYGISQKDFREANIAWASSKGEGRERDWTNECRKNTYEGISGWSLELWNQNGEVEWERISSGLQVGLCISGNKTFNRGGWRHAQQPVSKGYGCEEGQISGGAWVDHVEVQESSNCGPLGNNEVGHTVYNLQVEGHPSYSVEGFLVHNCMLMPKTFLDSASNLSKCPDFKLVAPGNPNETTNAHGMICEPAEELGGWEGGIDQSPGTKFWKTRYPNGGCLQLPGGDSPNLKAPQSEEAPFPFICTREHIAEEAAIWGSGDWHFDMFINAKMPRGQGSNRIITRQECEKHGATLEPFWRDSNITKIASLDAAYRSSGGDRCVFTEINFGRESESTPGLMAQGALAFQNSNAPQGRQIMALVDQVVIPIDGGTTADTPEAQIRKFCQSQCAARGIPPENFFLDSGMRTSLVQEMSRNWSVDIQSIDCGATPTDQRVSAEIDIPCHDYYKKLITQIWFSVRLIIIARQFRNLSKDAMWELCAREWKTTSGNKIEAESKLEMKEKTGKSPDLGDGLCLAAFGATKRGFQISTLRAQKPQAGNRGPDWRDKLREKSRKIWSSGQLEYSEA